MAKNNFRGMPGGMNQAAMMKQAQKMQQEMLRMQAEQEAKTFTAKAGGGMVAATVNGKHELVNLEIKPEAVDPDDVEMLQDMVIAAVNEAMRTADADAANNMSRLTGGLNLGGLAADTGQPGKLISQFLQCSGKKLHTRSLPLRTGRPDSGRR